MTRSFKAGMVTGYIICFALVGALLFFGAYMATKSQARPLDTTRPYVQIQLRAGYGLSKTPRAGWVKVIYRHRTWWVTPADLIPQPCVWTAPYELNGGVHGRICKLDPRDR